MDILVIGGVAAGASFAARARRLNEQARITVLERGPDVSFANCGLPYHVGKEIENRSVLAVQTPASLNASLKLDVRTRCEAIEIDRAGKRVRVRHLGTQVQSGTEESWIGYDALMLAPGAAPMVPPLPGIDDSRLCTLRSLEDMDRVIALAAKARRAVVVGAGFIGLEMAEQLHRLGLQVSLIELQPQVLPQLDPEMTLALTSALKSNGIQVHLGQQVTSFRPSAENLTAVLGNGEEIAADLVILSIGVRPETSLAAKAGLMIGPRGHIIVNEFMQTSDPDIYAAGDAVETRDRITGAALSVPLGGPANRQGRVAADHLFLRAKARPYPGSLGTAIVRAFDSAAGIVGWSERRLISAGIAYDTVTVNDHHHATYYPGAKPVTLKICWDRDSGRLLGAQCFGLAGVDKRLDVLSTAITAGMTVEDLCHLELAYAPPFGSAKDIVNLAGFAATNMRDGLVSRMAALPADAEDIQIIDVRGKALAEAYPLPATGVMNIPFAQLRASLDRIDRSRPVLTVCSFGKMSYFAARVLAQNGFNVFSLSGGIRANIDPTIPNKL